MACITKGLLLAHDHTQLREFVRDVDGRYKSCLAVYIGSIRSSSSTTTVVNDADMRGRLEPCAWPCKGPLIKHLFHKARPHRSILREHLGNDTTDERSCCTCTGGISVLRIARPYSWASDMHAGCTKVDSSTEV